VIWNRSLAADVRVLAEQGATRIVCLLERHELDELRITSLPRLAEKRGIAFTHFPIVDVSVPSDIRAFRALVRDVARELRARRAGGRVVVHCKGGLGRTGLVAGCVLVELGWSPIEALEALVEARGRRCPETMEQVDFVASWRKRLD
jgi:ADP-ribosyl-[dinitrogen reductase] hydrolase